MGMAVNTGSGRSRLRGLLRLLCLVSKTWVVLSKFGDKEGVRVALHDDLPLLGEEFACCGHFATPTVIRAAAAEERDLWTKASSSLRHVVASPRYRVFGVGWAKSGTHSLAKLLGGDAAGPAYRVALAAQKLPRAIHEPLVLALTQSILDYANSAGGGRNLEAAAAKLRAELRVRAQLLGGLEGDVSFANAVVVPQLLGLFPRSKFILAVRDPYSQTESGIRYAHARASGRMGPQLQKLWNMYGLHLTERFLGRQRPDGSAAPAPGDGEHALQRAFTGGVWPLRSMFSFWCRHVVSVVRAVPPAQLLVVRTDELQRPSTRSRIAMFLGLADSELGRPSDARAFRTDNMYDTALRPFDLVDGAHVGRVMRQVLAKNRRCATVLRQYFPEPKFRSFTAWKAARDRAGARSLEPG